MSTPTLSIFDLDHTLIDRNASFAFGKFLWKMGHLRFSSALYCTAAYFRHKVLQPSMKTLHTKVLGSFLQKWSFPRLQEEAERFLDLQLEKMFYAPALARLREAQSRGHHVVLMSGSPDFLVEPIARRLEVPDWEATRYVVDKNDRLHDISTFMEGSVKADLALARAKRLQIGEIHAFTDSLVDLPLLEVAGSPIGVRPERRLKEICHQRGWEVI